MHTHTQRPTHACTRTPRKKMLTLHGYTGQDRASFKGFHFKLQPPNLKPRTLLPKTWNETLSLDGTKVQENKCGDKPQLFDGTLKRS